MSSTLAFSSKEGMPISSVFRALDEMALAHPAVHDGTFGRKVSMCLYPKLAILDTTEKQIIARNMGDYTYLHTIVESGKPVGSILKFNEGVSYHGICAQSRFDIGGDFKYERNLWIWDKVAFALNGLVYYWYKRITESEKYKSRLKNATINPTDGTDGLTYSLYLAMMLRQNGKIFKHDLITRPVILDMRTKRISAYCFLSMQKTKEAFDEFGMEVPENLLSLGIWLAENDDNFVVSGKKEGAATLLPSATPRIMSDGETFIKDLA